ncbi:hypothetical protein ILYODFUR_009149 [Ilyodon furcidens]|uniref:Uncharacterized protein n=1 Tax=Ilyodon furcidens TaxID=33524 RepID=A0ABV0SVG3_9TELE
MYRDETKCIEKETAVEARWGGDELQPASPRRAGSGGAAPRHRAAFVRLPPHLPLAAERRLAPSPPLSLGSACRLQTMTTS